MHTRYLNKARRGFTLIEILIVVVILGILAAIVIPQFTDASTQASEASLKSQLQTIRGQLELYRVKNNDTYPDLINNQWADMLTDPNGEEFLQGPPKNPLQGNSTTVAAAAAADVGWVWDGSDLYAVNAAGDDTFNDPDGNPY